VDLIIENIRCFASRHTIPVKPFTLLTGENSSGKSTFLAALAAVHDPLGFPLRPRFNEPPYSLGNFDTIATYKGGRYGRASSFALGYTQNGRSNTKTSEIIATYVGRHGLVEISEVTAKNAALQATLFFVEENGSPKLKVTVEREGTKHTYEFDMGQVGGKSTRLALEDVFFFIFMELSRASERNRSRKEVPSEDVLKDLSLLFGRINQPQALSIAPIRTRPKRTYDQITEEFTPEGEHIPFVLSSILDDPSARATLERFGEESGLFKHIGIKKLGDKISDPVQVMVTSSSRPANLLDVGYGVSQALPVVVQSVLAARHNLLLLQQPEVHLHPRAQAALGSLMVDLLVEGKKQFVVETHSDYIIDRVRQEVANGKVSAESVSILYFERQGGETCVYPLSLDKAGNVLNAPPTYREFFLKEELALFNRADLTRSSG
jgi:energy-coupling factor transporter ATP-binding protein EcfA2